MPLPLANSYPASAISFPLTSITHRRKTKRTQFGAATLLTERTQFPPKSHKTQGQMTITSTTERTHSERRPAQNTRPEGRWGGPPGLPSWPCWPPKFMKTLADPRVGQDGILCAAQRAPRSIAARADWGRPLGPARRLPSGQPAPHRFFDPAFFRWRELEREGRRAHQRCGRPGPPHDMP